MTSALGSALTFIISFVFETYLFVLLLRLLFQKFGAHFFNPISQLIIKITDPIVKPMRRLIPGHKGIDYAIVMWLLIFQLIELILLIWLRYEVFPGALGAIVIVIGELGNKLVNIFFFAAIIAVILSWIPSLQRSPVADIVNLLTAPLFRPVQRVIPSIAGFDFSPIIVIIVLKLITIVIFNPIISYGLRLAFS